MTRPTPPPHGGFMLLELLASTSIILVLASLLLPALAATRERAARTQCLNNHRQLLLGWSLFANDHHGTLPSSDREQPAE